VESTAETVAGICPGMRGPAVRSLFSQLYVSPACAPHAPAFEAAYARATMETPAIAAA